MGVFRGAKKRSKRRGVGAGGRTGVKSERERDGEQGKQELGLLTWREEGAREGVPWVMAQEGKRVRMLTKRRGGEMV